MASLGTLTADGVSSSIAVPASLLKVTAEGTFENGSSRVSIEYSDDDITFWPTGLVMHTNEVKSLQIADGAGYLRFRALGFGTLSSVEVNIS